MNKKIKTLQELEEYLFSHFRTSVSSIDEINTFEHYSLTNDREHNYKQLARVYKILGENVGDSDYDEIFILIFSKNGGIFDSKTLGEQSEALEAMWGMVDWEE